MKRPADDLDAFVLVGLGSAIAQAGRVEDVDGLVRHARARHVRRDRLPLLGGLANLLGELALGGLERRLAFLVEAARGDLQEVRVVERLARLADEVQVRVVVDDDARRALVAHDLALDLVAVGEAEAVDRERHDLAFVDRAAPDALEAAVLCAHDRDPYPESSSSNAKVMSSMPCSEAWVTRSSDSWLRSVPLARFVHSRPAATNAFASDAPPVLIRFGV